MHRTNRALRTLTLVATALLAATGAAQAQQLIDHNKALAGGISPGDTPGYPITLSRPGHYKLMSNLVVPAGSDGIVVTADDVTLDMNGFTLAGAGSCTRVDATRVVTCSNGFGIGISVDRNGLTLRDGTVRGFGYGVIGNEGETLLRMHITQNSGLGVGSGGTYAGMAIIDSVIDLNGGTGVMLDFGRIRGGRVGLNGSNGIDAGGSVIVEGSVIKGNRSIGMKGGAALGTSLMLNGTNRSAITSLGGNLDAGTPF